jgi:stage III sporulation protein AE
MITPVIDSIKSGSVKKTVSILPGIGNLADGMMEVMMGSAVLIKNSIGMVFVIILLAICIVPLLKIFLIAGCLKFSAALMGIVSDKRITNCTDKVGEGSFMLFRATGSAMLLFLILIAIAAYTTNQGY